MLKTQKRGCTCILYFCVRLTGLEPARRETLDPKSSASTNFATGAWQFCFITNDFAKPAAKLQIKIVFQNLQQEKRK